MWLDVSFSATKTGLGTVGYRLYKADGTDAQARTTTGVVEIGHGAYGVDIVSFPAESVGIEWDTGDAAIEYAHEGLRVYQQVEVIVTDLTALTADVATLSADVATLTADVAALAVDVAAVSPAVFQEVMEGTTTYQEAMRLITSGSACEMTRTDNGDGTDTLEFMDVAASKVRFTSTGPLTGGRTTVVHDVT